MTVAEFFKLHKVPLTESQIEAIREKLAEIVNASDDPVVVEDPPGSGKLSGYSTHISIIDEGVNK